MAHVGVDLHKRTSQIAVLTEDGELTQHRLENEVARVEQFFAQLPPKTPVAIETSGTWWYLVVAGGSARGPRPSADPLASQTDQGHRRRAPQE